jgi:Peptidase M50B-like
MPRVQPVHLPLSSGESVAIGLVTAAVVLVPLLGVPAAHFSGMTREGIHALLAVILGVTVAEIVLDRHSGGKTSIVGEGLRVVLVFLLGYIGPSLFGLGAALLISLGYPVAVLWLLVVLLVLVLFLLARSFGLLSVPFAIAALYVVLRYAHGRTEVIAAYAVAWLLLVSGVRTVIAHGMHSGATDNLRSRTHLPYSRGLWWLLWLAGTVAALLLGGKLLVLG